MIPPPPVKRYGISELFSSQNFTQLNFFLSQSCLPFQFQPLIEISLFAFFSISFLIWKTIQFVTAFKTVYKSQKWWENCQKYFSVAVWSFSTIFLNEPDSLYFLQASFCHVKLITYLSKQIMNDEDPELKLNRRLKTIASWKILENWFSQKQICVVELSHKKLQISLVFGFLSVEVTWEIKSLKMKIISANKSHTKDWQTF